MLPLDTAASDTSLGVDALLPVSALLVEDDPRLRTAFADALRHWGFSVRAHDGGLTALQEARAWPPDVLVTDLELPDITGFDLARGLRDSPRTATTPILVVSAHGDETSRRAAFAAGADCFLAKPCAPSELLAAAWSLAQRGLRLRDSVEADALVEGLADVLSARDLVSRAHMERSARLAEHFGALLGLGPDALRVLRRAGFLHDVGKLAVDERILAKPGPLTAPERERMQRHCHAGARLCARFACLADVVPVIRHHHEHWDGSGYPDGLAGTRIPYLARVFQIADVFDALTSKRPYKPALPMAEALDVLRQETDAGRWDPQLAHAFLDWAGAGMLDDALEPVPPRGVLTLDAEASGR